jgi:hypothetical protein
MGQDYGEHHPLNMQIYYSKQSMPFSFLGAGGNT